MQADDLQKYIQYLSSEIKRKSLKADKNNTEYHSAVRDMTDFLDEERQSLISSYEFLKKRGAL